jgi:hypothetical protein
MKTGHWVLIGLAVVVLYLLFSSTQKTTTSIGVGGSWYDKLLAGVGIGVGSYVKAAGPNAFGGSSGGYSTSGGVVTSNPAVVVSSGGGTRYLETSSVESSEGLNLGWGEMKYRDEPDVYTWKD